MFLRAIAVKPLNMPPCVGRREKIGLDADAARDLAEIAEFEFDAEGARMQVFAFQERKGFRIAGGKGGENVLRLI